MKKTTTVLLLTIVMVACSNVPPTQETGAVNVAEKDITLFKDHRKPASPADMMSMTAGSIRLGESYAVIERWQFKDPETGNREGPRWIKLQSTSRPEIRGWTLSDTIKATRVN